jgi:hypothetical protein
MMKNGMISALQWLGFWRNLMSKENKTSLTPEERITVAWAHYVKGIHQHTLAAIFNVNAGRVAEACVAVRNAVEGGRGESNGTSQ